MIEDIKKNYKELSEKFSKEGYYLIKKKFYNIVCANLEAEQEKTKRLTKKVEYYKDLYFELKNE